MPQTQYNAKIIKSVIETIKSTYFEPFCNVSEYINATILFSTIFPFLANCVKPLNRLKSLLMYVDWMSDACPKLEIKWIHSMLSQYMFSPILLSCWRLMYVHPKRFKWDFNKIGCIDLLWHYAKCTNWDSWT